MRTNCIYTVSAYLYLKDHFNIIFLFMSINVRGLHLPGSPSKLQYLFSRLLHNPMKPILLYVTPVASHQLPYIFTPFQLGRQKLYLPELSSLLVMLPFMRLSASYTQKPIFCLFTLAKHKSQLSSLPRRHP